MPEIVGVDLSALPPVQPAVVFPDRVSSCSFSSSSYTSGLGSLSFFLGILSAPHTGPPSRGALTDEPQVILVRLVVVGGFEVWVVLLIMLRDAVVVRDETPNCHSRTTLYLLLLHTVVTMEDQRSGVGK